MLTVNHQPIDSDLLADAVLGTAPDTVHVLDMETGQIVEIPAENVTEIEVERVVQIPRMTDEQKMKELKKYTSEEWMVGDDDVDEHAQVTNMIADGKRVADIEATMRETNWWIGWDIWIGDTAWEFGWQWLLTLDADVENVWEPCDDCEVCRMMEENPHHTQGDLHEAFDKQRRKNRL